MSLMNSPDFNVEPTAEFRTQLLVRIVAQAPAAPAPGTPGRTKDAAARSEGAGGPPRTRDSGPGFPHPADTVRVKTWASRAGSLRGRLAR